ncbi:Fanconi anemia group F protein [Rhinophrynus dorsalis]
MAGKMQEMLENLDHFIEVLALSRSVHVKDWDILNVQRAFEWSTYFRHVHHRFKTNDHLRNALESNLRSKNDQLSSCIKNYQYIHFDDLTSGEEILCMSLLQNKALPKDVFNYLIAQSKDGGSQDARLCKLNHIMSQKAAAELLLPIPSKISDQLESPIVVTQADLLRSSLENRIRTLEKDQQLTIVSDVLNGIPQPLAYHLLAALLISDGTSSSGIQDCLSQLLLEWLLANDSTWTAFCSTLSCHLLSRLSSVYPTVATAYLDFLTKLGSSMEQDLACEKWVSSCPELSFTFLVDHFRCLMEYSDDLKAATETKLKALKMQDGNYSVPGISIWTDLLLEINKT